jgi:hypothetical protein
MGSRREGANSPRYVEGSDSTLLLGHGHWD